MAGQRRHQDHVGVFGQEEHRKGHTRVFDMEAGDDFRFAFGHVERRTVGFGDAGNHRFRLLDTISTQTSEKPMATS
jgi:hypothetical protein